MPKDSLKTKYAGPNWGIVDRNVQGGGDSYLTGRPDNRNGDRCDVAAAGDREPRDPNRRSR